MKIKSQHDLQHWLISVPTISILLLLLLLFLNKIHPHCALFSLNTTIYHTKSTTCFSQIWPSSRKHIQDHWKQIYTGSLSKKHIHLTYSNILTLTSPPPPRPSLLNSLSHFKTLYNFTNFLSFIPRVACPHYTFSHNNIQVRSKISNPHNCEYIFFFNLQ